MTKDRGAAARRAQQQANSAVNGTHWAARQAAAAPPKFKVGDKVQPKRKPVPTSVVEIDQYGMYVLEAYPGASFGANDIERAPD